MSVLCNITGFYKSHQMNIFVAIVESHYTECERTAQSGL